MKLNRIILSADASERLKQLKAKTGLAPNILSRIGFCLSLSEPGIPNAQLYPETDREFNRYTLLGEWDDLYVALLRQRLLQDSLALSEAEPQFRAHLNRGIEALAKLVKSLDDILKLSSRASARLESLSPR